MTFGGSALRTGGGYAESVIHILEDYTVCDEHDTDNVENAVDAEREDGINVAFRESDVGRRGSSSTARARFGFTDSTTGSCRSSLSKFQT